MDHLFAAHNLKEEKYDDKEGIKRKQAQVTWLRAQKADC